MSLPQDFYNEYELVAKNYSTLVTEIEIVNEVLRECQMKMKIADTVEAEHENEMRMLKSNRADDTKVLKFRIQELEEQNLKMKTSYEEHILQLQGELKSYKIMLSCKKDELEVTNTLFENLKDDYMCIQAEVGDRRIQLQDNMNVMKSKYTEMKCERASHLKEITILRSQNSSLMARWQAEIDEKKSDYEIVLESYKNQIHTQNYLIENYKKEVQTKTAVPVGNQIKFFESLLASKNKDIEALRERMFSVSLNENIVSYDLAEARREIRKHTIGKLQLENEIRQLKSRIEELQVSSPIEKEPQIKEDQVLK